MSSPTTITGLRAREILDSRGRPTIEVDVHCGGVRGRASVPSGASTGKHEVVELRDRDPWRFQGKGVLRAVGHVHKEIASRLVGTDVTEQERIDRALCELDGTPNKARLGANAILGVSLACAQAAAAVRGRPLWRHLAEGGAGPTFEPRLPLPMINLISGGMHAGGNIDFQDFLLLPIVARSFNEALEMGVLVYRALAKVLARHGLESVLVGDEGGFGPRLSDNEQGVQLCVEAIRAAGLVVGLDAAIAVDVASTHFFTAEGYKLATGGGRVLTSREMADLLERWTKAYPLLSIEDGMAEDDWEGWRHLTERLGTRIQLIGDDLFATNSERLRRGIAEKVGNSVLVKVNQIGTLTETLEVIGLARAAGYRPVISARSGETEDATLADLAVGTGAGQIKIGSIVRGERLAKYNQLWRIEEELGAKSSFARWTPLSG